MDSRNLSTTSTNFNEESNHASSADALSNQSRSKYSNGKHEDESQKNIDTIDKVGDEKTDYNYLHGSKLCVLIAGLVVAVFLTTLNASIIATAILSITNAFDTVRDIGWYGAAYLVANCLFLPISGKLYTHYSSKLVFICFLAIFEIGSLLCATAISSNMFIAGRAIAGAGGAGIFNGAFTIIAAAASIERRPLLAGIAMSISTSGQVVGPLIGGALTERASWRWFFYINVPAGVAVIALISLIQIPSSANIDNKRPSIWQVLIELDIAGFALFAPACVLLLLAIELGGTSDPWNSAVIIGLFCGSGGFAILWGIWNFWRGDKAMIPFSLLRSHIISFSCVTGLLQWGGLLTLTYYLPIWFQVVRGDSPLVSGISILPTMIPQVLAGLISGWLITKLGYYLPWALLGGALTAIGAGLMSTFLPSTPTGEWIGYQIIAGAGRGMVLQIPIIAVQTSLPKSRIPIGTGLVTFSQYFGATIFVALAETVLSTRLPPALKKYAPDVDPRVVLNAGATDVRSVVSSAQLPGVVMAYDRAITQVFYLATGAGAVSFFTALGMGWKSVKKAKQKCDDEILDEKHDGMSLSHVNSATV